ncbi:ATPase [Sinosporangium siamense]|uniref:ATPase n=2 Tax=Sinosporangium siamense TaxID=1367973 RepID=A0A919RE56_9ACTN|nr:ATPase [Sinosporangium siamense]
MRVGFLAAVADYLLRRYGTSPAPDGNMVTGAAHTVIQAGTVHGDITLASPPKMSTAPRTLPRDTPVFTGRQWELDHLSRGLAEVEGAEVVIYAVNGMPGVGKTALAVHAAHRMADRFPDARIQVDLHAHTPGQAPSDPADILADLLIGYGVEPQGVPRTLDGRAGMWRDRMAGKKILLVLDNAASGAQVEPLLPGTPGSLVLITSRNRLAVPGAVPLTVGAMPRADGVELFTRSTGRPIPADDAEAVDRLVAACGGLPLAITIMAARYAHRPAWSVGDLADQMAEPLEELQEDGKSVAVAFELSYRDLPPARQRLVRLLGVYPGDDIDAHAAAALGGVTLAQARRHLDALYAASLLQEPSRGRYRLHDLLAHYTRALADTSGDAALERLLDYYTHTAYAAGLHFTLQSPRLVPTQTETSFATSGHAEEWLRTERDNLYAAVLAAAGTHPAHAVAIPAMLADYLALRGHWEQALALHQTAETTARRIADPGGQAVALDNMGCLHRRMGEYTSAADLHTRALHLHNTTGNRRGQAGVHVNLGVMHRELGEYTAAAAHHTGALALYTAVEDHRGQAVALFNLGLVHCEVGEYTSAAERHSRALEFYTAAGDRRGQAVILNSLGGMHRCLGEYEAAADCHTRALLLYVDLRGRRGEAIALNDLGLTHRETGDYPAAADHHTRALDLYTTLQDRRGQATARANLGVVHRLTGDHTAASDHLTDALESFTHLGSRYGIAHTLHHLGNLHRDQGRLTQALTLFTELGNRYEQAETLNDLGELHHSPGRFHEALAVARTIGAPLQEARALEGIGLRQPPGDGTPLLRQALAIYRRIGSPRARRITDVLPD